MNKKQRKTHAAVFKKPTPANIAWKDIESLLHALGATVSEGGGSRVRVAFNDVRAVFHRPHPQSETDKGTINSVQRFLKEAGEEPL